MLCRNGEKGTLKGHTQQQELHVILIVFFATKYKIQKKTVQILMNCVVVCHRQIPLKNTQFTDKDHFKDGHNMMFYVVILCDHLSHLHRKFLHT